MVCYWLPTAGNGGYLNKSGNVQIVCKYTVAHAFSEGLAAVTTSSYGLGGWAYIDPSGQGVILQDNNYTWASSFNQGKAVVIFSKQLAFIDSQGKRTIGSLPKLTSLHERYDSFNGEIKCKEGEVLFDWKGRMNAAKTKTGMLSFISSDSNMAENKLVLLKTEGSKYGFIINGKEVPCQFDEVPWYDQTLAVVRKGTKFGLVSLKEDHVVSVTFKEQMFFSVFGNPVQATLIVKNLTSEMIHDMEIEYPDGTRHAVGDMQANTSKELPVFLSRSNDLSSEEKEYEMRFTCDGIILSPIKNKVILEDKPSLRVENFSTDRELISFNIINESDISLDALSVKVLDGRSKSYFDKTIPLKGKGKVTCEFNFPATKNSPKELEIIAKVPGAPEVKVKQEIRVPENDIEDPTPPPRDKEGGIHL
ncbi:MAG: WG repeat-containing protein [Mangrovibacterium sp.]